MLVGLGGVLIEALDAAELLPADISHDRAIERILGLRGAKMLGKFRGRPARDVHAVADVVVKVGAAMRAVRSSSCAWVSPPYWRARPFMLLASLS